MSNVKDKLVAVDKPKHRAQLTIQIGDDSKTLDIVNYILADRHKYTFSGTTLSDDIWDFLADRPIYFADLWVNIIAPDNQVTEFLCLHVVKLEGWRQVNDIITYMHRISMTVVKNPKKKHATDKWEISAYTKSDSVHTQQ